MSRIPVALFVAAASALTGVLHAQETASSPAEKIAMRDAATLGAETRAPTEKEIAALGLKLEVRARGQMVTKVEEESAAARSGIESGDVLIRLEANELFSRDDIEDFLSVSEPGRKVKAVIVRGKTSEEEEVTLSLGKRRIAAPETPRLEWQYASLGQLGDALARAKKEDKLVLVGLSGAET